MLGLLAVRLWAFEVTLEPEEIGKDETATLVITHSEAIEPPVFPVVEGLTFQYQGVSQFSSLQVVNGKTSMSKSFQYAYVIFASREGKFTIPSFEVRDKKNQVFHTEPLVLRVVKRKPTVSPSPSAGARVVLPRLWYELVPDRSFAAQNERLILTGYLMSDQKEALFYPIQEVRPLVADNCLVYDGSRFLDSRVEKRGGYWARAVNRWVMFGVEPGVLPIMPPQMIAVSPFGQMSVPTENIRLDIRRSPMFLYRGTLAATVSCSPLVVTQGMSVTYRVVLRGTGNLSFFSDVLHGVSLSNITLSPVKVSHALTNWEREPLFVQELLYTLSFAAAGEYDIPSLELTYLDDAGQKRRLVLPAVHIKVYPRQQEQEVFVPLPVRKGVQIRYVGLSVWFWLVVIMVVGLPWAFVWWRHHEERMESDQTYARYVRSFTQMQGYFREAEEALHAQDGRRFASVFYKQLSYFLIDRERLPRHVDKEGLITELMKRGWKQEECEGLKSVLETLEAMAYAPNARAHTLHQVYEKGMEILREHYRIV